MGKDKQELGKWGEDVACWWLKKKGLAIIARRFRIREAEIDIIARRGNTLFFLEIKTRRSNSFGEVPEILSERDWEMKGLATSEFIAKNPNLENCDRVLGIFGVEILGKRVKVSLYLNS